MYFIICLLSIVSELEFGINYHSKLFLALTLILIPLEH